MRYLTAAVLALTVTGCVTPPVKLNDPVIKHQGNLALYSFVFIEHEPNMKESYAIANTTNAGASSKEFAPTQLMEGMLLKKGLVRVESVPDSKSVQTLIIKWGVSGKRDVITGDFLSGYRRGFAQEVTISLMSAATLSPVFTCTAEGLGTTEIDDIRDAIVNCLSGL